MIQVNATVQHRVKHLDYLLSRELIYLQRQHEENLLMIEKYEKFIRHETNHQHLSSLSKEKLQKEKNSFHQSFDDLSNRSSNEKEISSTIFPSDKSINRRRRCLKSNRLPPIIKANVSLSKQNPLNSSLEPIKTNQNQSTLKSIDQLKFIEQQQQISSIQNLYLQSFLQTLPQAKDIQSGFDCFRSSSFYSLRYPLLLIP